ncbi:MAG: hypothetical protein GF308_20880 [Candidatus Heimdallarchaeota archaeon]|nr:hypothetical protein [Candidatus Heimdallarchaeota archaeon]
MSGENRYNQIFHIWRNERQTKELLPVSSSIYSKIRQRIKTLEDRLENSDTEDVSFNIIRERKERLSRILNDLARIRMHKIIQGVLKGNLTTEGLAIEEIGFVKDLERLFEEHRGRVFLGEEYPESCDQEVTQGMMMTIRLLQDVPEIVVASPEDGKRKSFGPFKKEDIVRLPIQYAKTLIMKNAADRIELPNLSS